MLKMRNWRRGAAALAFFALLAAPVIAPGPGGMLRVPGPVGDELVPVAEAADTQGPAISADAGIVVDAKTGEVLFAKNADKREYPASMTKMMTCVLALEEAGADELVVASANAADVECTRIHAGDTVRMSDLLRQMMTISDNGAATAVGEAVGGDIPHFAEKMNAKARELGCTGTHFVNANGMPDSDHYSTAHDMARIMSYALGDTRFRAIIGIDAVRIYYVRPAGRVEFCENTNELLTTYPGCIGGKTGWTNAARGCLAVAAKRNGRTLVAVVMHSQDDESRFTEAARLLDYGFAQ